MTAATTKTYAQKSSAVRAAKKAHGEDYLNLCSIKGSDATGWYIETEKVVVVEAAPMTTPKLPVAILEAKAAKAEVVLEEKLLEAEAVIGEALTALHDNDEAHAALEAETFNPDSAEALAQADAMETSGDFGALQAAADKAANAAAANLDPARPRISTTELPTKKVWQIADEMMATNAKAGLVAPKRKEVIEECVRRGVAYGTARTQYQHWFKTLNDSAAAPIAKINPDGSISYPSK